LLPPPPTDPDVKNSLIRFLGQDRAFANPLRMTTLPQGKRSPSAPREWGDTACRSQSTDRGPPPRIVMPGFAFPPVGPWGHSSPPSQVLCSATTASAHPGRYTCRSLSGTVRADRGLCPPPPTTEAKLTGPPSAPGRCPGLLICQYPRSSGVVRTETVGSPEFPSRPFERMPRSQTPVVTGDLAIGAASLLPSSG
jgi:hypothetical protein